MVKITNLYQFAKIQYNASENEKPSGVISGGFPFLQDVVAIHFEVVNILEGRRVSTHEVDAVNIIIFT